MDQLAHLSGLNEREQPLATSETPRSASAPARNAEMRAAGLKPLVGLVPRNGQSLQSGRGVADSVEGELDRKALA
jgi:hypothetical protein